MTVPWRALCRRRDMDPSFLLTTGQSFSWLPVDTDVWVGVIDSAVLEVRKVDERVEFRTVFGSCEDARVRRYFDLEHEYKLDRDRAPASVLRVVDRLEGVRILQQEPLETLVSFICSANNNIKRITRLCFALRERYGTFIGAKTYDNAPLRFHAFPNLRQLAAATTEELRELGLGYRASYLSKTLAALKAGGIDAFLRLRQLPAEEAQAELVKFHGVGRKVANCVMLFGLGMRGVVPVDVHVKQIARVHFKIGGGTGASYDAVQEAFTAISVQARRGIHQSPAPLVVQGLFDLAPPLDVCRNLLEPARQALQNVGARERAPRVDLAQDPLLPGDGVRVEVARHQRAVAVAADRHQRDAEVIEVVARGDEGRAQDDVVDALHGEDVQRAVHEVDHRERLALDGPHRLVVVEADDQVVAQLLRALQEPEMADVEDVEAPVDVDDPGPRQFGRVRDEHAEEGGAGAAAGELHGASVFSLLRFDFLQPVVGEYLPRHLGLVLLNELLELRLRVLASAAPLEVAEAVGGQRLHQPTERGGGAAATRAREVHQPAGLFDLLVAVLAARADGDVVSVGHDVAPGHIGQEVEGHVVGRVHNDLVHPAAAPYQLRSLRSTVYGRDSLRLARLLIRDYTDHH
ncbi:7,8 dihydro-8-oxoguanine DNA glycosylase [Babesia caballi]|uniref:DNA-(apurinic or apyrimidinic site) lyase n=1 Tax=Babesia caballi TaxID=5871 RepID=A0AAV4M000_BABCB|nr:7,8 dihydro-8-oxoguanine DNA glycosylase [Babesia caballi]